jgi:tRNA threonylcarbamoyladenosine biosynthesis protein TsaE
MKKANFPSESFSGSPEQTLKLGKNLSKVLNKGQFISLKGPLGAGKTVIARGILQGFGYKGPVTSPTFTVINEYPTRPPVYHMDFYRIMDEEEGTELGLGDLFCGEGIYIAEWCDKIPSWLPPQYLEIEIQLLESGGRLVKFSEVSKPAN